MEEIVAEATDLLQGFDNHIVTMRRWGDEEGHSYVIGTFTSFKKAKEAAVDEEMYRGGKYNAEIVKVKQNIPIHHGNNSSFEYEKKANEEWKDE